MKITALSEEAWEAAKLISNCVQQAVEGYGIPAGPAPGDAAIAIAEVIQDAIDKALEKVGGK